MPQGQFPTIPAGGTYVASLLQSMVPLTVYKANDTSRATTTSLTADPDLQASVVANGWYFLAFMLSYEGGTQGSSDLQVKFTTPPGTTMQWSPMILGTSGSVNVGTVGGTAFIVTAGTNGAGNRRAFCGLGTVSVGSTAGTVALNWAQGTSSATATIVHALSSMFLIRMA